MPPQGPQLDWCLVSHTRTHARTHARTHTHTHTHTHRMGQLVCGLEYSTHRNNQNVHKHIHIKVHSRTWTVASKVYHTKHGYNMSHARGPLKKTLTHTREDRTRLPRECKQQGARVSMDYVKQQTQSLLRPTQQTTLGQGCHGEPMILVFVSDTRNKCEFYSFNSVA